MPAYFDTGILVPLYVKELFSPAIKFFLDGRSEFVPIHLFHRLELENALRLKVFRGEMDDDRCREVLDKIRGDIGEGLIVLRPVDWVNAMEEARRIGAKMTTKAGCRTLDLLHVAIAVQWEAEVFVTADDRQLKAARAAGLRTVDVRTLPRGYRSGGGAPDAPPGTVREKRARYGSRRNLRRSRPGLESANRRPKEASSATERHHLTVMPG
jgi:predicted nucleic acid-binding protein